MHPRKERVQLHGRTNLTKSEQAADMIATRHMSQTMKLKPAPDILESSVLCFRSTDTVMQTHGQIGRPRFAHLEETQRRKPVFVGDSYVVFKDNIEDRKEEQTTKKRGKGQTKLIQAKHDEHGTATQETQLIGMEKYSKQTLEGKVDVQKVKEIRRSLRRRYGNRKNFQKIFSLWDEEGKGAISVKNIYTMVKKIGLHMNLDEVRTLVASADMDRSGDLTLDEFMNMIFNDNEAFNVDWNTLNVLTGEQQSMLLEGADEQLELVLRERQAKQQKQRHFNQLNLVLKNKLNQLHLNFMNHDPLKSGLVNYEKFTDAIHKQQISEKIMTQDDIKDLYDQFKKDDHSIDYRQFLQHLKQFELQSDYELIETNKKKPTPAFSIKLNPVDDSEKVHVFDCNHINAHHLTNVRSKANRLIRTIKRYLPEKNLFDEQLLQKITTHKYIDVNELTIMLKGLLESCGETIKAKELGPLLSIMQFNGYKVPSEQLGYYLYDEGDDEFYERCSLKKKGPLPDQVRHVATEIEVHKHGESFYDPLFGLSSVNQSLSAPISNVLQKVEEAVFRASARQMEVFQAFDIDHDGYISEKDLQTRMKHILNNEEIELLCNHLKLNEHALNFQEFHAKLYPGMTVADSHGLNEVVPQLYPHKQRTENLKDKLPNLKRFKESHEHVLKAATRFGATPLHKNTFLSIQQPPRDSALYMNEEQRFTKDYNSRLRYLHDEQAKEKQISDQRLIRIRNRQEEIAGRIEQSYQTSVRKEAEKNKTKGLAAWSYEQRAHLQNDWQ